MSAQNSKIPDESLKRAYEEGVRSILTTASVSAPIAPEAFSVILEVEKHRWFWRPAKPRIVLIAESHVYTSEADLQKRLIYDALPQIPMDAGSGLPASFVRLVYCLGYGESRLLSVDPGPKIRNSGTIQYWDLFGALADRGRQPRGPAGWKERLAWKIATLQRLKELGVWLMDASVHAIALGRRWRRPEPCCRALHEQWWRNYGSENLRQCGPDVKVWVIGAGTLRHLKDLKGFRWDGSIYQPNARGSLPLVNRDRLLDDVHPNRLKSS